MKLFDQSTFAGVTLKNRIIRSATHEGMADLSGMPLEDLQKLYLKLANGGVGMIITGYAGVQKDGRSFPNMKLLDDDKLIPVYEKIFKPVKETGVPVILQIAHAGGMGYPDGNSNPHAPSRIKYKSSRITSEELANDEIDKIIQNFVNTIVRAKKAGFDGVQIHAAHGYLLSEFLSPNLNRRKDKWGGSTENRFRIIKEIMTKAREAVGAYPIIVKISAYDDQKNGMTIKESVKIALMLEKTSFDAIEVSCGNDNFFQTVRPPELPIDAMIHYTPDVKNVKGFKKKMITFIIKRMFKIDPVITNYNVPAALEIKKAVSIPVIVVGGIRNLESAENIIESGSADYIAMSRPFIIEPDIVKKWESKKQDKSKCTDCDYCLIACKETPLRCYYGKI